MNKIFITIVLFFLALTVVATDELYSLLDNTTVDLSTGVVTRPYNLADFNQLYSAVQPTSTPLNTTYFEPVDQNYSLWYHYDFAEEPFDGRLDIMIGKPLPNVFTTTLLMFGAVGIIYMYHRKSSKEDKTLFIQ